jgi:hypothetical protein
LGVATSSLPSRAQTGSAQPDDNVAAITDGSDFPKRWEAAMAAWRSGIEQVDAEIEALGKHLTASDDRRLRSISETGLNAITGDHKVRAMAALMEVSGASTATRPKLATNAEAQVMDFMLHLSRDPRVAACDDNPFGVKVAVRETLVPLLERLESLLAGATAD